MTDEDKRKVINALLCAADDANNASLVEAADAVDPACWKDAIKEVIRSYDIDPVTEGLYFNQRMHRHAYRLVESSAALRREWFGEL
jgi:hypothetical protein